MRFLMLQKRADFIRARTGVRYARPAFVVEGALQPGARIDMPLPPCRFGITISNKTAMNGLRGVAGKKQASGPRDQAARRLRPGERRGPVSVTRNRMRRRLKAALGEIAPRLSFGGLDLVVTGRPALLRVDFQILIKDLEKSFQKVHRKLIPTHEKQE